jgi:uncharacterized protein YeaO (DUF488 family)
MLSSSARGGRGAGDPMTFQIKRVYEPAAEADGTRVLVDRLWPRGLTRSKAQLSLWMKDIAPSPALRTWFGHDPRRFAEFKRRYATELRTNAALPELKKLGRTGQVTLLYGAHDPAVNHAIVLLAALRRGAR